MQPLVPPATANNPNSHTAAEITAAIAGVSGTRKLTFRYDLLTSANVLQSSLTNVLGGTVRLDWLANIKRTATFSLTDLGGVNFLQDRIKPWVQLHLPPWGDSDYVEWPLGVFLLSTPTRSVDEAGIVIRDVAGYDQLQVVSDDKVTDRYTAAVGAVVTTVIGSLLSSAGITSTNITASASTLPTAKEWEPGTPKLAIINDLLGTINYDSLFFDESGVAVVKPYVAPSVRTEEWSFADDATSIVLPDVEQTLDLFAIANRWVLVVSDPDRIALTSTYTNVDPSSPTSTVSRQRTIVDFRTEQDAVDQAALDAKAARLAFEASQVYEQIEFETGIFPLSSANDVYHLTLSDLAINAKFSETSWEMTLQAGSPMRRTARRVVTV